MQKELKVTIKGITPLLVGKMGVSLSSTEQKHVSQSPPTKEDLELNDRKTYKMDGQHCFPFTWIMESLKAMSKREKEPGKKGGSYFKTLAASVQVEPEWIILETSKMEIFGRYIKTKMKGDRVWTESPMFKDWRASFTILVDNTIIDPSIVRHFLEEAGRLNGIGGWRPERGGRFGKFVVT